ncbi:MAG: type II toxin-antitoxin system RelE/ParE family toxin [Proteobacteria bacterium]|nr:type II toxin-antitoxin system RelE/ParE family toxin [Pseudomonadota bacterium]
MADVILTPQAYADLVRLEEFLWQPQDPLAAELLEFVLDGLHVLTHQPGVGRPLAQGQRELIISRGRGGYLARYVHGLVLRQRSDVEGCASPSDRSARRIAQPIPSVLASDATQRCDSRASADRQMTGDATLARRRVIVLRIRHQLEAGYTDTEI